MLMPKFSGRPLLSKRASDYLAEFIRFYGPLCNKYELSAQLAIHLENLVNHSLITSAQSKACKEALYSLRRASLADGLVTAMGRSSLTSGA